MIEWVKKTLLWLFPDLYYVLQRCVVRRNYNKKLLAFQTAIADKLYGNYPIEILSGPFKGMRYINEVGAGLFTPKWLGSYEEELHSVLHSAFKKNYVVILNVGAAEGYYAVGFAREFPDAAVFAFDVNSFTRRQAEKIAEINQAVNVTVSGRLTHRNLERLAATGKTLMICDIEGDEFLLLNPRRAPSLLKCDFLAEIHGFGGVPAPIVRSKIITLFQNTHHITEIRMATRDLIHYHRITENKLTRNELMDALNEHRGYPQTWLWMEIK